MIALARPDISPLEVELVNQVLRSDTLSLGQMNRSFEDALAAYVGAPHGIAVSSGTAGLHTVIRALGLGPGDEVVTTSFSFVATANAILYEGATPVFADIEPEHYGLDPAAVEAAITSRTKGILAVDVFGHPCRLPELGAIARRHGLPLIDDGCEALGAAVQYRDVETRGDRPGPGQPGGIPWVPVGNPLLADATIFAFFPNKQITTGEGGMIVTEGDELARLCRSLRNQGRGEGDHWLEHERLGFNYRLDEMSAAVGWGQMQRIEELLGKRARVAALYGERLADVEGVRRPLVAEGARMSWFVYVVRLEEGVDRDGVMADLDRRGIPTRPYFRPIHLQPYYRERFGHRPGTLPRTEAAGRSCLALPFHGRLTEDDVDMVVRHLGEAVAVNRARVTGHAGPPQAGAGRPRAAAGRPRVLVLDAGDDRWDEIIAGFPVADVYYERGYARACTLQEEPGTRPWLFVYQDGDARVVLPFLTRPVAPGSPDGLCDAASPYGYSGPLAHRASPEVLEASAREFDGFCRSSGIVTSFVRFHPLLGTQDTWRSRLEPAFVRHTVYVDLSAPELILANMDGSCRRKVRQSMRSGLTFAVDGWAAGQRSFRDLYEKTMKRRAAEPWYFFPDDYYETLARELAEEPLVATLSLGGRPVATVLVLRHRPFMHMHLSGSDLDRDSVGANNLIEHDLAHLGAALGYTRFHLGGGYQGDDSLYRFKAGFNRHGQLPFLVGKWVHLEDEFRRLWERAQGQDAAGFLGDGFFPPYRSRGGRR